jgi:hypothetical protein
MMWLTSQYIAAITDHTESASTVEVETNARDSAVNRVLSMIEDKRRNEKPAHNLSTRHPFQAARISSYLANWKDARGALSAAPIRQLEASLGALRSAGTGAGFGHFGGTTRSGGRKCRHISFWTGCRSGRVKGPACMSRRGTQHTSNALPLRIIPSFSR